MCLFWHWALPCNLDSVYQPRFYYLEEFSLSRPLCCAQPQSFPWSSPHTQIWLQLGSNWNIPDGESRDWLKYRSKVVFWHFIVNQTKSYLHFERAFQFSSSTPLWEGTFLTRSPWSLIPAIGLSAAGIENQNKVNFKCYKNPLLALCGNSQSPCSYSCQQSSFVYPWYLFSGQESFDQHGSSSYSAHTAPQLHFLSQLFFYCRYSLAQFWLKR